METLNGAITMILPARDDFFDAPARFLDALRNGGHGERINDAIERLLHDIGRDESRDGGRRQCVR